ncbi:hypothetical protein FIBSPDRAFT_1035848 [Athelia psychrophila]|uniref:Ubiquitin 3 binding protein But2 C-terminal domain-containing protein n=1 Tax=Athelia psychrophila TaxID=1759441 RepID=A0A166WLL3_9AGAM|nr:hypothetical protein FIBSPDRAFT_1035848 [Fibularhizoctonia sp. CBS 109695]
MKSIAASALFVLLAIGSATTGVAALPSAGPDSAGHLARDSSSGTASNTPAAANRTLATALDSYNCPRISVSYQDSSTPEPLSVGFQYPEYHADSGEFTCSGRRGESEYAVVSTTNSYGFYYNLAYDGTDCTMKIIHESLDGSPYDGKYLRPSILPGYQDYLTYDADVAAIHCELDVAKKTLVLKDNINGYRYGLGKIANPSEGYCTNAYYIDVDENFVTFNVGGDCYPA